MEKYETLELEIVMFSESDVILTSSTEDAPAGEDANF